MIDPHNDTWRAVRKHCDTEIEAARRRLEEPGREETDYAAERGIIIALRAILALGAEKPKPIHSAPTVAGAGY